MNIYDSFIDQFVICRAGPAGNHTGILVAINGTCAVLKDARCLWRWRGANTLNEVSQDGVDMDFTRISEAVPLMLLTQVSEVIPCSEKARKNLETKRWGE